MPRPSREAEVTAQEEELQQFEDEGGMKSIPYEEEFWEVVFSEKTSENETTDVQLCVNGEALTVQRGKPVIIAGRFLEAADHTKSEVISQEPGKDRKTVAWVQTYSYTKVRKSSKAEFISFKRKGDQITKEARERAQAAVGV